MALFPKFIVENGNLIISRCTFHKELVKNIKKVQGGGWFILTKGIFILYGDSCDLGNAKFEDIKEAVERGNVFTNKDLTNSIAANEYRFIYQDKTEFIPLN